jgi:hypothetical protein
MPFGLETMHKVYDITITVNCDFIVIQPQVELSQDIKNEILDIQSIPGHRISWESRLKSYYLLPATASDKLATAERIAIGLEEKGLTVLRLIDHYIKPVICQSYIIA